MDDFLCLFDDRTFTQATIHAFWAVYVPVLARDVFSELADELHEI
jgi:hypothetical protein